MTKKEKILDHNGTQIYYYTVGDNKREAVMLLHPAFADHHIFSGQVDYLSKEHFVVLVDMIGHGKSCPGGSRVKMGDMPEILSEIMAAEKIGKAHLAGVSLGSLIVQAFADKYPERVRTVTIVGGYSIHKDNKEILKAQAGEMGKWLAYFLFSMKRFRKMVTKESVETERGRAVFLAGAQNFTRRSFSVMGGMNGIFAEKAEPMGYPMLIVCGAHDLKLIRTAGRRLHELEDNSTFVEVEDAGHCANIDNPNAFNKAYSAFISKM